MKGSNLVRHDERLPEKTGSAPTAAPAVDIYESESEILLICDMPGVARDAVNVGLEKDVLTIEGKRQPHDDKGLIRAEFRPCDFRRAFTVPQGLDVAAVEAKLDKGVLRVRLPKSASVRPRRIEIKAS